MDTTSQKSPKKRFWLSLIIITFLLGALYLSFFKSNPTKIKSSASVVSVEVIKASQQTIPVMLNAVGSLTALKQIEVSPQVAGHISRIGFVDGQRVHTGDLLFQLDDADTRAQLASTLAQLRWSQLDYERKLTLFKQGAVAKQVVDLAQATLLEDEALAKQKQVQVENTHLRAPFAGKMSSAQVSVGQYVAIGQTLATLVGLDHLRVTFSVPEIYLPQLRLSQIVHVVSSVFPNKTFTGIVLYISPLVDVTTRMVEVQADIPNSDQKLTPGMFVKVSQKLGESSNYIVIPDMSLIASIEGNNVFIIKDGRTHAVPVKIGQRWNNQVEILSGLNLNDLVVIAGQQNLRDGTPIKIVTELTRHAN